MKSPKVTIGGLTATGATSYDWELIPGTRPVTRDYTLCTVQPTMLQKLQAMQGTVQTLQIEGPRKTLTVSKVHVVGVYPGEDPFVVRLAVADNRWLWSKKHVSAGFNMRRATGDKFAVRDGGALEQVQYQPEIEYAYWSLLGGAKYTVQSLLDYMFSAIQQPWKWAPNTDAGTFGDLEIENLLIDDNGADAVERALAYIPGAGVYIDTEGVAVVYDTAARIPVIPPAAHQIGRGFSNLADLRAQRPSRVDVLFTREPEIRFNFFGTDANTGTRTREGEIEENDKAELINVVQVCKSNLAINGKTYGQGSWVPIDDWIAAINAEGTPTGKTLSQDIIRKFVTAGRLGSIAHYFLGGIWDPVWLRRMDMIRTCWRRCFQIKPIFWQRIGGVRAIRAGYLNYVTGARAPSVAYCDHMRAPSLKVKNYQEAGADSPDVKVGWAVEGYATNLEDGEPAPVHVTVADPDAGVIMLTSALDIDGATADVALGYPANFELPSIELGEANRAKNLFGRWDQIELRADFKLATVLTCIPASPNDTSKLFRLPVYPQETTYGLEAADCLGPPVEVRVFPGIVTALMAWTDGAEGAQMIDAIKGDVRPDAEGEGGWPDQRIANAVHLTDVARAVASRVYEPLLDRPYGSATVDLNPGFEINGNVASVRHDMAGGATSTTVRYSAPQQARNIWRFLDSSTRRVILRNLSTRGTEGTS